MFVLFGAIIAAINPATLAATGVLIAGVAVGGGYLVDKLGKATNPLANAADSLLGYAPGINAALPGVGYGVAGVGSGVAGLGGGIGGFFDGVGDFFGSIGDGVGSVFGRIGGETAWGKARRADIADRREYEQAMRKAAIETCLRCKRLDNGNVISKFFKCGAC